jgi:hypothetical protein
MLSLWSIFLLRPFLGEFLTPFYSSAVNFIFSVVASTKIPVLWSGTFCDLVASERQLSEVKGNNTIGS